MQPPAMREDRKGLGSSGTQSTRTAHWSGKGRGCQERGGEVGIKGGSQGRQAVGARMEDRIMANGAPSGHKTGSGGGQTTLSDKGLRLLKT